MTFIYEDKRSDSQGAFISEAEDLTVVYHQQDTNYYCGAACAQMVLDSIGAGLLNQDDLYNDNHSRSTTEPGWYTAPDGLLWTMNNLKPPSPTFNSYFVLDALLNEDSISRAIIWTIHHYRVAPIGFDDTSYSISGFVLKIPGHRFRVRRALRWPRRRIARAMVAEPAEIEV